MYSLYISLIVILIIASIILIKCLFKPSNNNEKFVNNPIIITDNFLNVKNKGEDISSDKYIIIESKYLATVIDNLKKTNILDKNTVGISAIPNNANLQLLLDPYINYYILNNKAQTSNYKEGIFVCISNNILREEDCIWALYGKVVSYIFMSDYLFIQALI